MKSNYLSRRSGKDFKQKFDITKFIVYSETLIPGKINASKYTYKAYRKKLTGGIQFTYIENLISLLHKGSTYINIIHVKNIPDIATITAFKKYYVTDCIELGEEESIFNLGKEVWGDVNFCHSVVAYCPNLVKTYPTIISDNNYKIIVRHNVKLFPKLHHQPYSVCAVAFRKNPFSLQFVKNKTPRICQLAVDLNPYTLVYANTQTPGMCEDAIRQNPLCIKYVKSQTQYLCELAYSLNKNSIVHFEQKFQHVELIIEAVIENPELISRQITQTLYICTKIIDHDYTFFPRMHYQSNSMCEKVMSQHGLFLQYVTDKTPYICRLAITNNPNAIEFVPQPGHEMWHIVLKKNPELIKKKVLTSAMFSVYFEKNPEIFQYIENPSDFMCEIAVKHTGSNIQYVKNKTDELCNIAIEQNTDNLQLLNPIENYNIILDYLMDRPQFIVYFKNASEEFYINSILANPDILKVMFEEEMSVYHNIYNHDIIEKLREVLVHFCDIDINNHSYDEFTNDTDSEGNDLNNDLLQNGYDYHEGNNEDFDGF